MAQGEISLFQPLPHQVEPWIHPARFKVLACGRRWGKDILSLICVVVGHGPRDAKGNPKWKGAIHGKEIAWVAPIYKQSTEIWIMLKEALRDVWTHKDEADRRITLPGGGVIWVRTGDNPDALRGLGLDGVVLNEAAYMEEDIWNGAIRPALSDKLGWCIFASTPNGEANWYHSLFQRATGEDWARWQRPTADNPKIPASELAAARREMGDLRYRQEYEADFAAVATLAFPMFRPFIDDEPYGVVNYQDLPSTWERVGGFDWGWSRGGALWAAIQPPRETGSAHIHIYREYDFSNVPPDDLALGMLQRQGKDFVQTYYSDGFIWGKYGHQNLTNRQHDLLQEHGELNTTIYQNFRNSGFDNLTPSSVSPAMRMQYTQMALKEQEDGWPLMVVHDSCPVLIDSLLNLQVDPKRQDIVQSNYKGNERVQDHEYDALGNILGNIWERLNLPEPVFVEPGQRTRRNEIALPAERRYSWGY